LPSTSPSIAGLTFSGEAINYNPATDSINLIVHWGDGMSDTLLSELWSWPGAGTNYFSNYFSHSYASAGTYYPVLMAFAPNMISDTVSPLDSVTVHNSCVTITGYIYEDLNTNCNLDASDDTLSGTVYVEDNSGNIIAYGYSWGYGSYSQYSLTVPLGLTNLKIYTSNWWQGMQTTCPAQGFYTFNSTSNQSFDFGVECTANTFDNFVFSNAFVALPGDTGWVRANPYSSSCSNPNPVIGTVDTLIITLDTLVSYLSMYPGLPSPDVISGNTLTWYLTWATFVNNTFGYLPFVKFHTITDTSASLGDSACFNASITPPISDIAHANNSRAYCREVNVSYDPNNKINLPSGVGPLGKIDTSTQTISYRINFQNTDTASARNIYVTDSISDHFDLKSLRVLGVSHPTKFSMLYQGDNRIRFDFTNIYLPDSLSNEEESKGYIDIELDLVENLPIGTTIENTAYIYFDYNAPIITNTAINTLYAEPILEDLFIDLASTNVTCLNSDNGSLELSVTSGNPPYSYAWSNGSTQGSQEDLSAGTYSVTVTDNESQSAVASAEIVENRIHQDPVVGEVQGQTSSVQAWTSYVYSIQQAAGSDYEWTVEGGDILSNVNNVVEVLWRAGPSGSIYVTQKDQNGCYDESELEIPILFVGVEPIDNNEFRVYPNPTDGSINISVQQADGSQKLIILDVSGRLVLASNLEQQETQLDLSHLNKGIYFIEVSDATSSQTQKLVIE